MNNCIVFLLFHSGVMTLNQHQPIQQTQLQAPGPESTDVTTEVDTSQAFL